MEKVIITNSKRLENFKRAISEAGVDKLHILADFDGTLTSLKNFHSILAILRDGNYLTPDYPQKAYELYDKYHPIEIDLNIPLEEKKKKMVEWWTAHFNLLIDSGLNKRDLKRVTESGKIKLRKGAEEFIDLLKKHNIPLVIMSSSGLGEEVISMFFKKEGKLYDNIHIVSNKYQWDKQGKAIRVEEPIIHVLNKDETAIQNFPVFDKIKNKKNVLLLGDSLGDIGMIKGFNYDNLIKVGFLNENIEESLEIYKQNYDILILYDSPMDYVNELLKEIIKI